MKIGSAFISTTSFVIIHLSTFSLSGRINIISSIKSSTIERNARAPCRPCQAEGDDRCYSSLGGTTHPGEPQRIPAGAKFRHELSVDQNGRREIGRASVR